VVSLGSVRGRRAWLAWEWWPHLHYAVLVVTTISSSDFTQYMLQRSHQHHNANWGWLADTCRIRGVFWIYFQTYLQLKFRIVSWDVLSCKIIVDRRFIGTCCLHHQGSSLMMEAVRTYETSVDNHFTRQYDPEDNSDHVLASDRHSVFFFIIFMFSSNKLSVV
jgi:hypothetical protein